MSDLLSHYHWLASEDGANHLSAATAMRTEGLADLKIGEVLRQRLDSERAALVLTQLDLRNRAIVKFARANQMLFTRAGLEQSTNESIATYRAARYTGSEHCVDLCCGLGGDLIALSSHSNRVTAVDRDPVHLFLAQHNASVYQSAADITPLLMNVENATLSQSDAVFIDPARRLGSGKRTGYQSEPSIEWSLALADQVVAVGIKTAPGIPHEMVPEGWELELIALGSELKEAVMWSPALASEFSRFPSVLPHRATVIVDGVAHTMSGSHINDIQTITPRPGQWLHDVNPAVTNAGLVRELAEALNANLIDPEIGFLVGDAPSTSPFSTSWRILYVLPWHEKRIKQAITDLDIGPIDIRRRGLPGDVPTITKRLRGKGQHRALIAMTRVNNSPTAIICSMD